MDSRNEQNSTTESVTSVAESKINVIDESDLDSKRHAWRARWWSLPEITLPEDQRRAFDNVANWMYDGKIDKIEDSDASVISALKSYQLADKYMMPLLQQAIIQEMKNYLNDFFISPRHVMWAVENLDESSVVRELLIDQFIWELVNNSTDYRVPSDHKRTIRNAKELDNLLTSDSELVVKWFWDMKYMQPDSSAEPARLEGCHYHVHPTWEKCVMK
ncbi:hypothetical protein H2200_011881 [Cladophialophora chaetospira]|uniref:Uncharacterized protein n=1 Tax=Cladophialophora chaetospira TaxID=386627 RepID=A0AA39CCY0_9EURO|nr:hypothetical protein H2200_011881 [Cladophialophora chaetospira]